jgi:hypothetical protein
MLDWYSKAVFTVIAIALSVIAWKGVGGVVRPAWAQSESCGYTSLNPCHIALEPDTLSVEISNWPER